MVPDEGDERYFSMLAATMIVIIADVFNKFYTKYTHFYYRISIDFDSFFYFIYITYRKDK